MNIISDALFIGLCISSLAAAIQDFNWQKISDLTWVPAIIGIIGYLWLCKSVQLVEIELLWAAIVVGVGIMLMSVKLSGRGKLLSSGDVIAMGCLSFALQTFVVSMAVGLAFSAYAFRNRHTGKVSFVGYLCGAFLVFTTVFFLF